MILLIYKNVRKIKMKKIILILIGINLYILHKATLARYKKMSEKVDVESEEDRLFRKGFQRNGDTIEKIIEF